MPPTHVPVLAGELIEALDPQPGQIAVDCTLGARRPRAPRRRADRPDRHADRDRPRPDRRGALRRARGRGRLRDALHPRRLRRRPAPARRRGRRAPTSSTWTSACPRCRSTRASAASPTPTTRRWTCGWTPSQELTRARSSTPGTRRRLARALREYGEERFADRIAGEIVRRRDGADRDHLRARRRDHRRDPRARALRRRPPGQAHVPGDPDRRQRRARPARRRAPARLGGPARSAAASPRSPSTRSRTGASSASSPTARGLHLPARPARLRVRPQARGRAGPPRSIVPTPGEVAANPRSKSARLRAARKLTEVPADAAPAAAAATPRPRRAGRVAPRVPRRVSGPSRARSAPAPRASGAASSGIAALPDHRVVDRLLRGRVVHLR